MDSGISLLTDDLISYLGKFLQGYYNNRWWAAYSRHWNLLRRTFTSIYVTDKIEEYVDPTQLAQVRSYGCFGCPPSKLDYNNFQQLQHLSLTMVTIRNSIQLPQLRTLNLYRCSFSIVDWLGDCPNLTKLHYISNEDNCHYYFPTQLIKLDIRTKGLFERDFRQHSRLTKLICLTDRTSWENNPEYELQLNENLLFLDTDMFVNLVHLTKLVSLSALLGDNNADLHNLTKLTFLEVLPQSNCQHFDSQGGIFRLPELREYRDENIWINNPNSGILPHLTKATIHELDQHCFVFTALTSLSVKRFALVLLELTNLKKLTLRDNDRKDKLSLLTSLTKLNLKVNVVNYPLGLRYLRIDNWRDNDNSVDHLSNLVSLTTRAHNARVLSSLQLPTQLLELKLKRINRDTMSARYGMDANYISQLTRLTSLKLEFQLQYVGWLTRLTNLETLTIHNKNRDPNFPDWLRGITNEYKHMVL